jgi:hypothetical protein
MGFCDYKIIKKDGKNLKFILYFMVKVSENINTGEGKTIDTNCLTGKQIITTTDKKGKESVAIHNLGKKKLKKLTDIQ